jgi:hypothetical protein
MKRAFVAVVSLALAITAPAKATVVDLKPTLALAGEAHLDLVASKKKRRARGFSGGITKHRTETENGSCNCTSSKVCVGPRGGRYCITSGGKKRYV